MTMDNLARNAMLARQAGMTYGKWKALHYKPEEFKPPVPEQSEYERVCEYCGQRFLVKSNRVQKYCEWYCRHEAQKQRDKERKEQNDK